MSCQRTGLSAKRPLTSKFTNSGKIFVKIRSVDLRAVLLTDKATDKPKDKQKKTDKRRVLITSLAEVNVVSGIC